MPLLRALADWQNRDHEGYVSRGDEFEASELRALDLVTGGLAVYAVSETSKIKVPVTNSGNPAPIARPAGLGLDCSGKR